MFSLIPYLNTYYGLIPPGVAESRSGCDAAATADREATVVDVCDPREISTLLKYMSHKETACGIWSVFKIKNTFCRRSITCEQ